MCGEVDAARRMQRVGESMTGHGLQSFAEATGRVAVVDDKSGTLIAHATAELDRYGVGAPFEDGVLGRLTQFAGQGGVEVRQRIGRYADGQIAIGADLDDALVPAVRPFDRLVNWQRVDEFVGENDARTGRHVCERSVPHDRHLQAVEQVMLRVFQFRVDFHEMQDNGRLETLDDFGCPQRVAHHGAAPGSKFNKADVFRRTHLLPHRSRP